MKKYLFVIVAVCFGIYMFGCGKKQAAMEELQEPMSMEALATMNAGGQTASEVKITEPKVGAAKLEPLPPQGPYKPSAQEIQSALKNAGFYTAAIDGKTGPLTKKAIEEFQKANGLEADGKVGPKTWQVLGKYLNPQPLKKR